MKQGSALGYFFLNGIRDEYFNAYMNDSSWAISIQAETLHHFYIVKEDHFYM